MSDDVKAGQIWERKQDGKRVRILGPEVMWLGKMLYRVENVELPARPRRSNLSGYRRIPEAP